MRVAGIIAEYNPFHNGHLTLAEALRARGAQAVVAVMGGDWLQRGEPALCPKRVRARAALRSGVDLVLELPLPYAAATAERFAYGGVALLAGLGCVDTLAFGSECGELEPLERCAAALEDPRLDRELLRRLKGGLPYAAARQQAAEVLLGPGAAEPFSRPNDTLAIQYLRELRCLGGKVKPFTLRRRGAAHHSSRGELSGGLPTASGAHLRELFLGGRWEEARPYLPPPSYQVVREALEQGLGADPARLELPLLAVLRRMSLEDFSALPDLSEGLEHRLYAAVRAASGAAEILERAKTKRYPLARLRRLLLAAYLGIPAELCRRPPPYLRVLGMNDRGARVLALAKGRAALPLSHSLARLEALGGDAARFAALEARAADLYGLLCPAPAPCGQDYTQGVVKEPGAAGADPPVPPGEHRQGRGKVL